MCLLLAFCQRKSRLIKFSYLEILACFLTLKTFCSDLRDCHIKAMIDNTTAISYINNMGVELFHAISL